MDVDTVEPVLLGARAGAAADGFEIDPEMPVSRVDAGEARGRARTVARGDAPLGCRLCQCADHQIGGALTGAGAAVDRSRVRRVMTVPSGAVAVIGRASPEFGRIVGSTTALTA